MAVTLEIGVGDLLSEFLADALIVLTALHAAGAIAAGPLEPFSHGLYHFLIFVQPNCHMATSFLFPKHNYKTIFSPVK